MRTLLMLGIIVAVALLLFQSYRLIKQYRHTEREYEDILKKMTPLAADNNALRANLQALDEGRSIERELRNAGYAAQGEKMIIIIPKEQ